MRDFMKMCFFSGIFGDASSIQNYKTTSQGNIFTIIFCQWVPFLEKHHFKKCSKIIYQEREKANKVVTNKKKHPETDPNLKISMWCFFSWKIKEKKHQEKKHPS